MLGDGAGGNVTKLKFVVVYFSPKLGEIQRGLKDYRTTSVFHSPAKLMTLGLGGEKDIRYPCNL